MNQMTLNSAILSFAFSGVFAPHRRVYEALRPANPAAPKKK